MARKVVSIDGDKFGAALRELLTKPAPERKRRRSDIRDLVDKYANDLEQLRKKGYSYRLICEFLSQNSGIKINHKTLALYARQRWKSAKSAIAQQQSTQQNQSSTQLQKQEEQYQSNIEAKAQSQLQPQPKAVPSATDGNV